MSDSKEATMTFRLDETLKLDFHRATALRHRPSSQVLRDFMRSYVLQAETPAPELAPEIDPAEREKRKQAVSYSRASVNLEGYQVSEEDELHAQRFISGQIDLSEFVAGPGVASEQ